MKKLAALSTIILLSVSISNAFAGTSEIKWTDPGSYIDIQAANEGRGQFKKRIFHAFEAHFEKLSEQLPEGYLLKVDVSDVDLAGEVNYENYRVIKGLYLPRMKFSYEVLNNSQSVVKSGYANIGNQSFGTGTNARYKNKTILHEKRMLDNWFRNTFSETSL